MAFPVGVSVAIIEAGRAFTSVGSDVSMSAKVTPIFRAAGGSAMKRIVHAATGHPMLASTEEFKAEAGSVLSFAVPHVDQPGWQAPSGEAYTMWYYAVEITARVGNGRAATGHVWKQNVQPLVGQDFIDLDLIADGPTGEPVTAPQAVVTSVDGQTGAVTLGPIVGTAIDQAVLDGRIPQPVVTESSPGVYEIGGGGQVYGLTPAGDLPPNAIATLNGQYATLDDQGRQPVRKGELVINVEDFGAVGDGVADDTAACQAAIDAAPEHATIMFPGKHLITTVTLNKPHIKLVGPGTIYQGKIIIGTTGARQDLYWTVDGLTFERSAIADNTYGIELHKGRRGTVQNCEFYRYDKAIYVAPLADAGFHDTAMIKIQSNEFDQVRYAFYVDRAPDVSWMATSDCKFLKNTVNLALITPVYAVSIDGIVITDNVTFFPSYNNANATLKADKMKNVYIGESDWVVISGNNFFESGVEAIHLDRPKHFTISDNLIAWPGQRVISDAIKLTGATNAVGPTPVTFGSISGNVVARFTGNAVGVYGDGGGLVSVKDNVLEYNGSAASYYGGVPLSSTPHYGVFRASASTVKVVDSSNEATGGIFSNQGGALTSRTWVSPDSIIGGFRAQIPVTAADTPLLTLNSTQGGTVAFTGLLIIEAKNVDAQTNVNSSSYVYHVSKHALGVSATKISEHGLLTGNSANWPSFTFTLSAAGKLLATPVGSTSGTFFFMVTFQGDLAALPA